MVMVKKVILSIFMFFSLALFGVEQQQGAFSAMTQDVVPLKAKKPLAEQLLFPNTTYYVRGTIDLQGETISVPENCILRFKRGCIKNGKFIFNKTKLEGKVKIECDIAGTVVNNEIKLDWFVKGSKNAEGVIDKSDRIQSIVDLGSSKLIFGKGYYRFQHLKLPKDFVIEGKKTTILPIVLDQGEYDFNFPMNVFYGENVGSIVISGISFKGRTTSTILPSFKSDSIHGEPLIWINKGDNVTIDGCVFADIENCTYCNTAYNEYAKKQGSLVCCWDVSTVNYTNNEQVNCRHDEQVWIIGVNKPIQDLRVYYQGNHIHDMKPGPNSSAFACVAGFCLVENNKVERYEYPGSLCNTFARKLIIRNNLIKNSYCSSVFDACESRYHHNDEIEVYDNQVEALNSVLLMAQSEKVTIKNNVFKGIALYYSGNYRLDRKHKYQYWYTIESEVLLTDAETLIEGNKADFTYYDGHRSIAGTKADYGTGEILEPQKYSKTGNNYGCGIFIHPREAKAGNVTIRNNIFTSFESLEGVVDENNLKGINPQTIRIMNTENVTICGNVFNGAYEVVGTDGMKSCITVYGYPDNMEQLLKPNESPEWISNVGAYTIKDNTFNVVDSSFYVIAFFPRKNAFRDTPMTFDKIVIDNNAKPQNSKPYFSAGMVFIRDGKYKNVIE